MQIKQLYNTRLHIPFVNAVQHASAKRSESYSFWVEAQSEAHTGFGEGCPRPYVTGEDLVSAEFFFKQVHPSIKSEISGLASLQDWVANYADLIDSNPAAWCAIELALLDLIAKDNNQTVENLLGLTALSGCFKYSAVIGAGSTAVFALQLQQYIDRGFNDFKIKLSGELARDRQHLSMVSEQTGGLARVRVDANNLFNQAQQAVDYFKALDIALFAIEEPVKAFDFEGLDLIARELNCPVILDESFLGLDHFNAIENNPEHWIINLRVSKMGGLLRSLAIVEQAKKFGIPIIVGAQVGETSLLTRAALPIAQSAQTLLVAQEGAFGTLLLQQDVISTPLMFGREGSLEIEQHLNADTKGFGLAFKTLR